MSDTNELLIQTLNEMLDMQKKQLEFLEEELGRSRDDLRAEMPAKKKVYQSLGVLGGILLAILIW